MLVFLVFPVANNILRRSLFRVIQGLVVKFFFPGFQLLLLYQVVKSLSNTVDDLWGLWYPVSMVTQLLCGLSGFAYRSCCGIDPGALIQTQRDKEYECLLPLIPAARPVGLFLPSWRERQVYLCPAQPGEGLRQNFSVASRGRAFHGDSLLL